MRRYSTRLSLASVLAVVTAASCSGTETSTGEIASVETEIVGGVAANSARLDAIGAIGYYNVYSSQDAGGTRPLPIGTAPRPLPSLTPGAATPLATLPNGTFQPICTATLIAPSLVLTAKHCTGSFDYSNAPLYFSIGADAKRPGRLIEAVELERAPGDTGGFVRHGRDFAVLHLAESVTDIEPLPLRTLEASDVGTNFAALGYGSQDRYGTSGARRAGTLTLRARSGRIYEIVFGTYQAFRDYTCQSGYYSYYCTAADAGQRPETGGADASRPDSGVVDTSDSAVPARDGGTPMRDAGFLPFDPEAQLRAIYENTLLVEGDEAFLGGVAGNAQPCHGDSGGPLLRADNGVLYVYGVVSGGLSSNRLQCDYGAVYATVSPAIIDFVNVAAQWVDPCSGLPAGGACEGDTASRCTIRVEGARRRTDTDCSILGQTCARDPFGAVACVDPAAPPPLGEPPPAPPPIEVIRGELEVTYTGPMATPSEGPMDPPTQ